MNQWEYAIEPLQMYERWTAKAVQAEVAKLKRHLDDGGSRGWEMIQLASVPLTGAIFGKVKGYVHLGIFKRPKAAE
jgi:hypothetical protein